MVDEVNIMKYEDEIYLSMDWATFTVWGRRPGRRRDRVRGRCRGLRGCERSEEDLKDTAERKVKKAGGRNRG